MRKFLLKQKPPLFVVVFFSFTLVAVLLLNLIPGAGVVASRLAIVSTKFKLEKSPSIISCFKEFSKPVPKKDKRKMVKELDQREKQPQQLPEQKQVPATGEPPTGVIIRKQYEALNSSKFINIGGTAFVRNMTSLSNDVVLKANKSKPAFQLEQTSEPQVLIYHTHTTECFEQQETDVYEKSRPTRSRDSKLNVVGVGEEIVKQLKARGIVAVHETKIYDDPAYTGAYDRTNSMITQMLKKYPKIKVVLDIHRDSITDQQKRRVAPVTEINGKKAAQIMIISGCDNGTNNYKNYEKNLAFACSLQRQIEENFPRLTRPVSFKYKHYNQSLSPGALLVEVGSQANSVQEAHLAGIYFGNSLASLLLKLQTKKQSAPSPQPAKNQSPPTKEKKEKTKATEKKNIRPKKD